MGKRKKIKSTDYKEVVADFELLASKARDGKTLIGLMVHPIDDDTFIMPICFDAAKDLAETILHTLVRA